MSQSEENTENIWNNTKQNSIAVLQPLLQFYSLDIDLAALISEIPIKEKESGLGFIHRFLDSLAFKSKLRRVKNFNLTKAKQPVIAIMDDGHMVLIMPENLSETEDAVFTSDETVDDSFKQTKYSGEILEITAENVGGLSYTEHLKRGHKLDWFWLPIVQYWNSYKEIMLASFFINLLVLAIPLYSLNVYDRVIITFSEETLSVMTIGVLIALTFDFFFKTVRSYILEHLAENLGNTFDYKLMERLTKIRDLKNDLAIGAQANMFRELQGIREFYATRLVPTLVDFPFILLFLFVINLIAPTLVIIPVITIAIIIACNLLVHIPISRITGTYLNTMQKKMGFLIESLSGLETLKMFNARNHRLFHWDNAVANSAHTARINNILISVTSNLTFTLSQFCHVAVLFFGVYQVQEGLLTVGGLITCSIISARAIGPAMNLASLLARLKQSQDVLKTIDTFFQMPYIDSEEKRKAPKGPFKGAIKIQNISYKYTGQEKPALNKVNLDIEAGKRIGIIGKTAAGKSTLAKITGGIMRPDDGLIQLDGYDYSAIPNSELRNTVAFVPQDSFFFQGPILYNITLGRENISDDDLKTAIEVSGLGLVLNQSGQGLDMNIEENGKNLSGGQKQAISLARAIIRHPRILIFDEPTTGMDSMLEHHVQKHLKDYIKDKTFIMITHRTSLLSLVDELVFVDSGIISAHGPKQEILAKLSQS